MPRQTFSDTLESVTKCNLRRGMKPKKILLWIKGNGFDVFLCTIYITRKNKNVPGATEVANNCNFPEHVTNQLLM